MAGSGTAHMRNTVDAVLTVRDLTVEFRVAKDKIVKAVSGLSFDVIKGETLAIVGESGCGKTTLARAVLQLPPPNSGEVVFDKTDLTLLPKENLRSARTSMQMIFQDPISSLDPRMTVHQLIDEPLEIWDRGTRAERDERINNLLNNVGLEPELVLNRRSYEFSGGQCQRISIARALALDPRMLICDEPVSALDVSIQAQILNLLQDMKDRFGLTMIFISHDLAVVKAVSNRVMVMYLGKICEVATPDTLYSKPAHHYTKALLNSVPIADPTRQRKTELLQGEPPSPMNPPSGCRFRTRCAAASALCAEQEPQLREVTPGQFVACHHPIV
ncbi:ABC transporter ATP-binding protein [Actinomycetes bacterium]|jgi:peptide/nickel transport system ATP-binding protein|nr:ABC transporter ATP-binding protein [Actinomycetes bacterium]